MSSTSVASASYAEHTVPNEGALAYLLQELYDTDAIRGRHRAPGVDSWIRKLRVEIIGLLPKDVVNHVLARAEALRLQGQG